jgi:uncharacterized protein YjbJ (UPF0337 family)
MENKMKNQIPGNWSEHARNLREEYPGLTEEDVKYEPGKEDDLFSRLEKKLKKSKDEIQQMFTKGENPDKEKRTNQDQRVTNTDQDEHPGKTQNMKNQSQDTRKTPNTGGQMPGQQQSGHAQGRR